MPRFNAHDGRGLHYEDSGGDGPPVLCLAGLSRNHRDFDALADALAPRFRVIRLDARGRGASDRAEDPIAEYSVPVETGDALALLTHLGLSGVGLVGTSRGGILGMAIASGQPGAIAALVLNDVGAVIEMRGLLRIMTYLGRPPRARTFTEAAEELRAANEAQFPGLPPTAWERQARCIFDDDGGRPVLSYDPHLRSATAAAMDAELPHVELWPMFDALGELPVLVLRGANSDVLAAKTVTKMAARHPGLAHVEVPDRGHAPFLDEPEAVSAISTFLARSLT